MIIHDTIEQGTPEWHALRAGKVTASEFDTVQAQGRGGPSKTRQTYMYKLAGQIITGQVEDSYTNGHMERGKVMEDEARAWYEVVHNPVRQVGFIEEGRTGYSPDGLVLENGLLEIKTKLPHLLIPLILSPEFPAEHKAQCQGGLWVSQREWIDLVCYWPGMPVVVRRAYRDEVYISELAKAVSAFIDELDEITNKVRAAA